MFNMSHVLSRGFVFLLALGFWVPSLATAATVDLSISASSVRFSEETLYSGETVRIYATIRNNGEVDSTAQVFFYQSDYLIGKSQPISVLADGGADDVFVDFKLPEGSFNIRAVIQGANPVDGNSANDVAITPLFKTVSDDDRDGILNAEDNCLDVSNEDQADYDNDRKGDVCDTDIDNDGVANTTDDFPRDASKSKIELAPPVVIVPPKPVAVVAPTPEVTAAPAEVVTTPEPVVEGSKDEQPVINEPVEIALDLSGLGAGGPVSSPSARFTFTQLDWRTYEFTAVPPLGGDAYTFAWDFGDGATSVQPSISHAFPASGVYTVTLATVALDGTIISDAQQLSVSFFHFGNPLLLATIGVLFAIILGLVTLILKLRKGEEV
jgi:PKD repeat protein